MMSDLQILNKGETMNLWNGDSLTQIQNKGEEIVIVDHFDKGDDPVPVHTVTTIDKEGNIRSETS